MTTPFDATGDPRLRRALDAHFARHPVDATFVGLHEHDARLPRIDDEGLRRTVSEMRASVEELEAGDRDPATADGRSTHPAEGPSFPEDHLGGRDDPFPGLDRRLLLGFLRTRIEEYESGHVSANPSVHVGDAVFGLMGPLLTDHTPFHERWAAVEARLAGTPAFLEAARERTGPTSVRGGPVPAAWAERAIRECRGAVRFLEGGLDRVVDRARDSADGHVGRDSGEADHAERGGDLSALRANAIRAVRDFARHLESEVVPVGVDDVACGPDAFDLYLREGHFLDRSADEIVAYARDEMVRTRSWLESAAVDFDASTPEEVVAALADIHPTADGYLERYGEIWREMRDVALERDLLTWPDFPVEYVERPRWARAAAPDLYFLFYRSPPAFGWPDVHRYMVEPLDGELSDEERERLLRANNDSVIKLNHVVHHGGIGHHVQNWHAFRSPSMVGRIAAVDCASRIAMFCGGTMAEGWACYATDLMAEAGGLTERERYAEHRGRIRMCARAIVDVELHHGRMSLQEAAAFYAEAAGMSAAAARSEAVKNSMFPGAALIYLVGTDMIHELRSDLMRELGDDFSLRGFHDAFLSYGSIPVRLIADEMRRRAGRKLPLDAHARLPAEYAASWSTSMLPAGSPAGSEPGRRPPDPPVSG